MSRDKGNGKKIYCDDIPDGNSGDIIDLVQKLIDSAEEREELEKKVQEEKARQDLMEARSKTKLNQYFEKMMKETSDDLVPSGLSDEELKFVRQNENLKKAKQEISNVRKVIKLSGDSDISESR